ncbi:CSLREA domain-containing protein [Amycolatopsis cihanbeyliensis]|uniref:CSLREA domain-containing protein n=1 Tax=Amycolatopsis cihanbeyliensis TaxID=1128664 RepID=A0A542DE40_AMYCI|nr:CSLREA domain-containing protein [Amycolatopsis cihanbeyliensis]TQJ01330.1 CSLREA domain-containing protein [Amycolatopsis cihanbeyliensis]
MATRRLPVILAAGLMGLMLPVTAQAAPAQRSGDVTYTVDSTADAPDADPGDGQCRSREGTCTLRAATMEANAGRGATIVVPAGHYLLTVAPPPLPLGPFPDPATGDLNILRPTTIVGAGMGRTVIDAGGIDRVFYNGANSTIRDLTITGGVTKERELVFITGGGGILNVSRLQLQRVEVTGNRADYGGGVFNIPLSDLTISDSMVRGNSAGEAGGIRFDWTGKVVNTTITGNEAINPHWITHPASLGGRGGGIDLRGPGPLTITGSTITGNRATDEGSGLNAAPAYLDSLVPPNTGFPLSVVILKNSTIEANLESANCTRAFAAFLTDGGRLDRTCHNDPPRS